jgi:hypothetical protein
LAIAACLSSSEVRTASSIFCLAATCAMRSQIVYNSVVYDARIFHADSDTVMFDHEVEEIFAQYVGKTPESVTANFHERVLCKAMTMFGMSNLCQWLLIHKELKSLTPTHIAFMEDTLKFTFESFY